MIGLDWLSLRLGFWLAVLMYRVLMRMGRFCAVWRRRFWALIGLAAGTIFLRWGGIRFWRRGLLGWCGRVLGAIFRSGRFLIIRF